MSKKSEAKVFARLMDAHFLKGGSETLQKLVTDVWSAAPNVPDRAVFLPNGRQCVGIKGYTRKGKNGGFSLAMVASTPGEQTSTILLPDQPEVDPDVLTAPDGTDFVDGAIYLHVRGNQVALIARGLRDTMAAHYLRLLLEKAQYTGPKYEFDLYPTAKKSVLAEIRKGVARIELNNSTKASTLREIESDHDGSAITGMFVDAKDRLKKLFGTHDGTALPPEDGLKAKIIIVKPKNATKADLQALGKVGETVFTDQDVPFTIVTSKGTTITPDKVRIQKKYTVAKSGKVLQTLEALRTVEAFGDTRF